MKFARLFLVSFSLIIRVYPQPPDTAIMHSMEKAIESGTYSGIHSILISRNDHLVYEKYWPGRDKKYGVDLGIVAHGKDSLHGMQSVTKSVVSACVGIALNQGKIKSIDQRIFDFFPEYATMDTGLKTRITIKNLLTMTAGFSWNEDNYNDPANDENQMETASDMIGYILSRPMDTVPGKQFMYNGGTTQLLAEIIKRSTGSPVDSFARKYLFLPMGIENFEWSATDSGAPDACCGLYLKSRDVLNFGQLYLNDGKWKTSQVVPAHWVKESITPYILIPDDSAGDYGIYEYGFQWWLFTDTIMNKPVPLAIAVGNGGQRIFIDKINRIVIIFTGGNYRKKGMFLNPQKILDKYIYPALFKTENN